MTASSSTSTRNGDPQVALRSASTEQRPTAVDTVELVTHVKRSLIALVPVLLIASACSSNAESDRAEVTAQTSPASLVGPDAFAARMGERDVVTINVHVPDEGHIEGTDVAIPFDEISSSIELPADTSTPLAIYCRSGNMSADAVRDLAAMGYDDIVELDGGFNAWVSEGRPLEPPET